MKKRSEKWSKNRGDERKLPWGVEEMREMDCQEVKKPKDRDQDEGMDGRGLGMACETSREGGEEMENICSVYLLRFGMHDYNPPTVPQAFCVSLCHSLSRPLGVSVFISVCFFSVSLYPSLTTSICHIATWRGWHSVKCLNHSGLGSGCFSVSNATAQYVVL